MSTAVAEAPSSTRCPRCGADLAPEQDWCLACGTAATTRIVPPPNWRIPVFIVAGVLALVGAGLAIAYVAVSNDTEPAATTTTAAPAPAAPPAAAAPPTAPPAATTPTPPAPAVASWPAGTRAYSVVLESTTDRAGAERRADALAKAGTSVGLLHSDDFPSLRRGYWVIFSGQYDTIDNAKEAAKGLQSAAPGAYPRLIQPR